LARLSHPNVVRFFSSWIEHSLWRPFPHAPGDLDYTANVSSIATIESVSEAPHSSSLAANDKKSDHIVITTTTTKTTTLMARSYSEESSHSSQHQQELVLFIQMEVCGITLNDWIVDRNSLFEGSLDQVDVEECHGIFLGILYGLDYVHSKGCIHR
jgi:serine/threonine protein kinase